MRGNRKHWLADYRERLSAKRETSHQRAMRLLKVIVLGDDRQLQPAIDEAREFLTKNKS